MVSTLVVYSLLTICSLPFLTVGYNLFLHPLRSYPGPWYAKASILWFAYHSFIGDYTYKVHELHLKYGRVVRIAPNELAYTDPRAWKDIYGHRQGEPENAKDPSQIIELGDRPNIVFASREHHSKLRRLLSNAFSDKAIREQEPVLNVYVQRLMDGLEKNSGQPLDLVKWYAFVTFDAIGHLAFAEPFDCLTSSNYHPWVSMIFSTLKYITYIRVLNRLFPGFSSLFIGLIPKRVLEEHDANMTMSKQKLLNRKKVQPEYTDFMTHMIQAEKEGQLVEGDLLVHGPAFVIAGSETTATLLSGLTFYVLKNSQVYEKLVAEIRSAFKSSDEISLQSTAELKYMLAVLEEALRLYPPGANNHPRLTPPQGTSIAGQYVPGGSMVGINHYAMYRSPLNFKEPDAFIPERALASDEQKWDTDRREALQPFLTGPRNCIGRNLAYAEMRLIICQLLFNFDLKLMPNQADWADQQIFSTWLKKPLMVEVKRVSRL